MPKFHLDEGVWKSFDEFDFFQFTNKCTVIQEAGERILIRKLKRTSSIESPENCEKDYSTLEAKF